MTDALKEIQAAIADFKIQNEQDLETYRQQYVGRKGRIAALFDDIKTLIQHSVRPMVWN